MKKAMAYEKSSAAKEAMLAHLGGAQPLTQSCACCSVQLHLSRGRDDLHSQELWSGRMQQPAEELENAAGTPGQRNRHSIYGQVRAQAVICPGQELQHGCDPGILPGSNCCVRVTWEQPGSSHKTVPGYICDRLLQLCSACIGLPQEHSAGWHVAWPS